MSYLMGRREVCHLQEGGYYISRHKKWSQLPVAHFELIAVFP